MRKSFVLVASALLAAVAFTLLIRMTGPKEGANEQVGPSHDAQVGGSRSPVASLQEPGGELGERESATAGSAVAVTIRTMSTDGTELDGVVVEVVGARPGTRSLGSTRSGQLEAILQPLDRLRATTTGFEVAETQFTGASEAPVTMLLAPLDGIHGFVVTAEGAPLGEGYRVQAMPKSGLSPATDTNETEQLVHSAPLSTVTDSSGRFYLPCRQGLEYRVHAGGLGMLAAQELRGIVPSPAPVHIELHDVLLARLRVVDSTTGESPTVCSDMWSTTAMHATCSESEVEVKQIQLGTTVVNLLGLDEGLIAPSRAWIEHSYLCIAEPPRDSVGPIEFGVALPGYEAGTVSVRATRVRLGSEPSILALQPTAKGWGSLSVSISGVPQGANRITDLFMPAGFVKLQSADGSSLDLGLNELSEKRSILTGLPFGSYSARMQLGHGMGKVLINGADQTSVEIGPADVHLDIGLAFVGAVELELFDAQGTALDGELHASLKSASGRSTQGLAWKSAPYIVQAIAEGRYAVTLSKPVRKASTDLPGGGWVDVVAGTTSKVRIDLP